MALNPPPTLEKKVMQLMLKYNMAKEDMSYVMGLFVDADD